MAFSLIKQSRKIIKKTFVASLTSNKPPTCILPENKAISGKKFYILIFCLCVYSRLSVSLKYSVTLTHLYTHIINKLLHGCLVCTILFTRCERLLTHSFAALTRSLVMFHNS